MQVEFQQTNERWSVIDNITIYYPEWNGYNGTGGYSTSGSFGTTGTYPDSTTGVKEEMVAEEEKSGREERVRLVTIIVPTVVGVLLVALVLVTVWKKLPEKEVKEKPKNVEINA